MEYVAVFCPHCGEHLNEVDEQDSPDSPEESPAPRFGTTYRCGWCGLQTRDWNHVVSCRRTWRATAALAEKQAAEEDALRLHRARVGLRRLVQDLEETS